MNKKNRFAISPITPRFTPIYTAVRSAIASKQQLAYSGAFILGISMSANAMATSKINSAPITPKTYISTPYVQEKSLVIIDGQLDDAAILAASVPEHSKIYYLDIGKDGIEQISEILSQHKDLTSVHLLSHGGKGYLSLGSTILKTETLAHYQPQITGWGQSLKPGADLMIYGCETAAGSKGAALLDLLSKFTGADVAGSTDTTGSTAKGGDWDLEYKVGGIKTSALQAKGYPHTLDLIVGDGGGGGGGGGGYYYDSPLDIGGDGGAGGGGADTLTGSSNDDVIFGDGSGGGGAGGNGSGYGSGGLGGSGADTISGGAGDDILFGDGFDGADGNYYADGSYNGDGIGGIGGLGGGGGGGGGNYGTSYYQGGDGGLGGGGGGGGDYGAGGDGGVGGGGGSAGGSTSSGDEGYGGGLGATDGDYYTGDGAGGGGGGGYFGTGGVGGVYALPSDHTGGDGGSSGTGTGNGGSNSAGDGDYSGGSGGGGFGNADGGAAGDADSNVSTLGSDGVDGNTTVYVMPDAGGVVNASLNLATLLTNNPNFGAGDDILDGGAGSDHLFGLGGNDTFVFELDDAGSGTDVDTVWDLNAGDMMSITSGGTLQDDATITTALGTQTATPGANDRTFTATNGGNTQTIVVMGVGRNLVLGDFNTSGGGGGGADSDYKHFGILATTPWTLLGGLGLAFSGLLRRKKRKDTD